MKFNYLSKAVAASFYAWLGALCIVATAAPIDVSTPRAAVPPNVVTTSNKPMVMLAVSKDHTIFGPIYTDFEDLDDDGIIDTTYKPTFKYYGYFDSSKCYAYSTSGNQFNPAASAIVTAGRYTCAGGSNKHWSGNFLNWSTMTRLDVVRKMLYGGSRLVDTSSATVLEGSELVWDAHSFVKYYRGTDIRDYTPFTTTDLTRTTGSNANVYSGLSICTTGNVDVAASAAPVIRLVKGNVRLWSTVEIQLCRWREDYALGTFGPKLAAYYKDVDKGNGGIAHELTIPSRITDGATYDSLGPELKLRVKVCDPSFLGDERCQAFPPNSTTNFKPYGLLQEFGFNPNGSARAEFGLITGSYDKNFTAGALRKNMSDFGDEINPSTGVFCHSASAGCAVTLADGRSTSGGAIKAIDAFFLAGRTSGNTYDGVATPSAAVAAAGIQLPAWGNPMGEMLVQALQYYKYNGTTPTPTNPASTTNDDAAGLPTAAWKDVLTNTYSTRSALYGNAICRPMHILAMSPSSLSFDGQANTEFATISTSPTLDDYTNLIGVAEGLHGTRRSVGSVTGKGLTGADDKNSCSAKDVVTLANVNGICPEAPAMGGTYQVAGAALRGNTVKIRTVASPPSDLNKVKDALKVKTLAASLTGGSPRIDIRVPGSNPPIYVYITPESVQNGGAVSAPLTFASISSSATYGAFIVTWNDRLLGGDYDMDITGFLRYDLIANASSPSGWEIKITTDIPSVCGGAAGTHGFSIVGVRNSLGASADGRYLTHEHVGGGSSTAAGGNLTGMPPTSEYLCGDSTYRGKTSPLFSGTYATTVCNVTGNGATGDPGLPSLPGYCTVKATAFPHSMNFMMVGETNALIKDPLYYAGKYGYFTSSTKNPDGTYSDVAMPTDQTSWDSVKADGTLGSDGVPDGYFLARRPELLEAQLRRALADLAGRANSAPVSSAVVVGGFNYKTTFSAESYDGNLEAYLVNAAGDFEFLPTWRAGQLLGCRMTGPCSGITADSGNSRSIITNFGNGTTAGMAFRWANIAAAAGYKTQMTTSSVNRLSDANAEITLNYIRGDQSNEAATRLRVRGTNGLGPVVNSSPWMQSPPQANYFGAGFLGYQTFADTQKNRNKILWQGANDGMLHAFNPTTGVELFAYVPGPLANRLAELPLQRTGGITKLGVSNFVTGVETRPDGTIWPYVDGSIFTGDLYLGSTPAVANWRTYLFGSLGRGGKAVFALDVTNPSPLLNAESGSTAQSIFKWQFTSDDDVDLGYLSNDYVTNNASKQPMPIAKMNNGKFAYLIGNGYKSTNGKAALYILFADGPGNAVWTPGTEYVKIIVESTAGNNGLSQVTWLDLDGNGTADVAYGGDLRGNMWKIDLSGTTPAAWDVAYKTAGINSPLFTAKTGTAGDDAIGRLPITTAPQYAFSAFNGPIILFATGNAFETADYPRLAVPQRVYAVWDRPEFKVGSRALPTNLSTLVGRTFLRNAATGKVTVTGSTADVNWATQDGWYASFPGNSEMVLADPVVRARQLIFTTSRPPSASGSATCTSQPDTSLYALDTLSGTAKRKTLGTSGTDIIVGEIIPDPKVIVVKDRTDRAFCTDCCTPGSPGCTCVGPKCKCTGPGCVPTPPTCTSGQKSPRIVGPNTDKSLCINTTPRLQWREIPGLRTDR